MKAVGSLLLVALLVPVPAVRASGPDVGIARVPADGSRAALVRALRVLVEKP